MKDLKLIKKIKKEIKAIQKQIKLNDKNREKLVKKAMSLESFLDDLMAE